MSQLFCVTALPNVEEERVCIVRSQPTLLPFVIKMRVDQNLPKGVPFCLSDEEYRVANETREDLSEKYRKEIRAYEKKADLERSGPVMQIMTPMPHANDKGELNCQVCQVNFPSDFYLDHVESKDHTCKTILKDKAFYDQIDEELDSLCLEDHIQDIIIDIVETTANSVEAKIEAGKRREAELLILR